MTDASVKFDAFHDHIQTLVKVLADRCENEADGLALASALSFSTVCMFEALYGKRKAAEHLYAIADRLARDSK